MAADHPKSPAERLADILDVHILDMAAQIEALLRGIREIQRGVLSVRGVPLARGDEAPAAYVQSRVELMLEDCETLRDAIVQAGETAARLAALRDVASAP